MPRTKLELYNTYWRASSSQPKTERQRLKKEGHDQAIGAKSPMIQNNMFKRLKELYDEAGVDDWTARIDHKVSYHEQKAQIKERYNVEGFEIDQEQEQRRLEALEQKWEEQAPDDAPRSQDERMRERRARNEDSVEEEDITEEDISTADEGTSEENGTTSDWEPSISSASSTSQQTTNQGSQGGSTNTKVTLDEARNRCLEAIEEAYQADSPILIDALPGLGKSYGAIEAAANTDTQITILTTRGRKEQYKQIEDWCDQHGLSSRILPSSRKKCPSLAGQHGDGLQTRLTDYLELGVTAMDLHHYRDLPCQQGSDCPYESAWDFDPDNYDVLIGHYHHAQSGKAISDRVVVIDEFPENSYITTIENKKMVSKFLQDNDEIPFNDYVGLLRSSPQNSLREEALEWFEDRGFDLRQSEALLTEDGDEYHALAPLAVLAVLEADDLGNGWEHASLGGGEVAAHNRQSMEIFLLRPPDLSNASGVVALDGTPTLRLWDLVFHLDFTHEQVLSNDEREDYIRNTQQLRIIQTELDAVLPYSSGKYANLERDAALIAEVVKQQGVKPAIITSEVVLDDLRDMGLGIADASTYYGNVRGSNDLANEDIGVILGSPHYGHPYIEKWAALFGVEAEGSGKGADLEYGPFGDEVLYQMRENEVLQAIFRFARGGSQSTVYVNTATIPGWVPRELAVGVMRKRTDAERRVIDALADLGTATGPDIASRTGDHKNTVRSRLGQLRDEGVVLKTGKKRGTKWHDNGLASMNGYGQVDLTVFTKNPHKISIRERGEKMEHQMQQHALDQRERERLLEQWEMEEWRSKEGGSPPLARMRNS